MTKKLNIAVVGGGIVGSTAAFYLAKAGHVVTLFDEGTGQATRAAAGIICPWLSQRRNKRWYHLTSQGAEFYQTLLKDLKQLNVTTDFYRQSGALVFKKNEEQLNKLYNLAQERRQDAPLIGEVTKQSKDSIQKTMPELTPLEDALFAQGGALVDGQKCVAALHQASHLFNWQFKQQKITIAELQNKYDKIILAVGAWLPELLAPLHYNVAVLPQKGQLFHVTLNNQKNNHYPVCMPSGEFDLLPINYGEWVIGATHEKDMGFDLTPDMTLLQTMKQQASLWLPELKEANINKIRVGTRAYTPDFSPFFGYLPDNNNILVASGLGSSGLTSGAYIGYLLHALIENLPIQLDVNLYTPNNYIQKII